MNEPTKPKNVITAARATFQWSVDKEAMANWAQDTLEQMSVAYGIQKQPIEEGLCKYQFDYDKLALLSETVINQIKDSELAKGPTFLGFENAQIIGHGQDAAIKVTADIDEAILADHSRKYRVLGAPEDVKPMDPISGGKLIRQSIKVDKDGTTLDGTMLLTGLKGIAEFFNQANEQFLEAYQSTSPFDKRAQFEAMAKTMNEKLGPLGVEYEIEGSKLSATLHIDKAMQYLEGHSGSNRGFTVKRNGDGTASMVVDYRKLVDVAADKAQALLAKHSKNGRSSIHQYPDSIDITLTKDGMEGILNGLINKMADMMVNHSRTHYGPMMDNLGSVAQPKR